MELGSTHVAYIKARRSEVGPDIVGERTEFRDTDLSYKTLRRRKPSEILAQIQRRGFAVMIYHWLSMRSLEEKEI